MRKYKRQVRLVKSPGQEELLLTKQGGWRQFLQSLDHLEMLVKVMVKVLVKVMVKVMVKVIVKVIVKVMVEMVVKVMVMLRAKVLVKVLVESLFFSPNPPQQCQQGASALQ